MKTKIIISILILLFSLTAAAKASDLPESGLTPDSSFYFLKAWKEAIQTFFTFGAENKAKQYLHLADVRLAEYERMVEKGKNEIAQNTLSKYEKQLSSALEKIQEIKQKGKDIKNLVQKFEETTLKHIEILERNLVKVPESAKNGVENAIENSRKGIERVTGACTEEAKVCPDGSAVGRVGANCEFAPCPETGDDIFLELQRLNIIVTGVASRQEMTLPVFLSGPNWGLKKTVCEEGGYDLSSYSGKSVLLTSYPISETYNGEKLNVWIISSNDKIACVYKAVREGSSLSPGIFPASNTQL